MGRTFKLYVAAQLNVVGTVLTQEECGKEFPVAYISRRMLDVETQYIFVRLKAMLVFILHMH
jgi:hypothetical protein